MSLQQTFGDLRAQLAKRIIGQEQLVDRLLIALLADGQFLVDGVKRQLRQLVEHQPGRCRPAGLARRTQAKGRIAL